MARDMGCPVAYLPGLTMRRIADLYPGAAKTDAEDAFIIADAARARPYTLHSIDLDDETSTELEVIVGFDDDLAGEAIRVANRLHGQLTQIHRFLERVLRPRLQHPAVLTLLERFRSPAQIRKAGRPRPRQRQDRRRPGRGNADPTRPRAGEGGVAVAPQGLKGPGCGIGIPAEKAAALGDGGPLRHSNSEAPPSGQVLDGHSPATPTERQPAQTSASSAGTVVARPSSLRAATDLFGSMPVNAGS